MFVLSRFYGRWLLFSGGEGGKSSLIYHKLIFPLLDGPYFCFSQSVRYLATDFIRLESNGQLPPMIGGTTKRWDEQFVVQLPSKPVSYPLNIHFLFVSRPLMSLPIIWAL